MHRKSPSKTKSIFNIEMTQLSEFEQRKSSGNANILNDFNMPESGEVTTANSKDRTSLESLTIARSAASNPNYEDYQSRGLSAEYQQEDYQKGDGVDVQPFWDQERPDKVVEVSRITEVNSEHKMPSHDQIDVFLFE